AANPGLNYRVDKQLHGMVQPLLVPLRDALAPFLKSEESRLLARSDARGAPFHYVLCAATSPAVKLQEETLTYLNQGKRAELLMRLSWILTPHPTCSQSIVRVVFHDRRLQYMEHQQLEGWRWNRPGDRILDVDVPLSVGIVEPRSHPLHLNTIEFLWDPVKNASVFIQVNCISTEFTPRKHGGEKGVPFRIQVDTFTTNEHGEYMEHVHSSSCQVKVFKPKGADRKLKTDREKMDKKAPQDREKYQPSHDTTLLKEVRHKPSCVESLVYHCSAIISAWEFTASSFPFVKCSPWPHALNLTGHSSAPSPVYHSSSTPCVPELCSLVQVIFLLRGSFSLVVLRRLRHLLQHLLPSCSPQDTQQWLHRHRFSPYSRLFCSFSGADLLRMSREDLIQICGPADGIRLFNTMKGRYIQPRLTIYVCQQQTRDQLPLKAGAGDIYQAVYLEELTLLDLSEKIAKMYSITPQQIIHIYRQKPSGIHVLVCDEVHENTDGFHIVLK
uniref:Transcription factor CP2-like 1 n=1 Tax=Salarias fasciatus TaxID=181472 RepID=A0A672HK39_SALFA